MGAPKTIICEYSSSDPTKDFEVHNPATGAVIATVRAGDKSTLDKAVQVAHVAFKEWKKTPLTRRSQLLFQCADAVEKHVDELAELLCSENGKLVSDARMVDVNFVSAVYRYFGSLVDKLPGEFYDSGSVYRSVTREPHGVCGGILPFNWPPIHTAGKSAPCIAMGNTIIIKPGEQAPLTSMHIIDILNTVLPRGVVQYVPGLGPEVPQALTAHPLVKMVSITGSTSAGAAVVRTAAALVKPTVLELGGKNALVVFPDADLHRAARDALEGAFFNKGEACTATSRLLIHRDVHDAFVAKLAAAVRQLRAGNGMKKGTHLGPCITQAQKDRVMEYIRIGEEEGATIAAQGKLPDDPEEKDGYFVPPTLFTNVTRAMRIAQEEIFGPVVTVCKFDSEEEAVSIINEVRWGLTCAIYSGNQELALRMCRQVDVGMTFINNYFRNTLGIPFGGVKETGYGREHCIEAMKDWSTAKVIQMPSGLAPVPSWPPVNELLP
ncbi:dehydrogenase [Hyaloscypha bicolor E]|uniref:aldehyde dehydrogenase (NAD(+)) n=1 Tax=Hyaloscypha bicolor E TaxID=1095630 RepID=A0A2J6SF24_9HELO|nr:dehydrogenase [Hyaloscypha bicolor E]PMD49368.1 dehydrogenase [Hyaloscypha bicolor E]